MQVASINLNEDVKVEFEFRGAGLAVLEEELRLVRSESEDRIEGWPIIIPKAAPPGVAAKS